MKEKSRHVTEESLKFVKDRQEAKVKAYKSRIRSVKIVFQQLAQKAKKNYYDGSCKIKENNRNGRTRALYQKSQEINLD